MGSHYVTEKTKAAECMEMLISLSLGKVAQSCPTLCDPMDCRSWNSPGQNTGMGSLSLLQGIFPTQRLNPGLSHCGLSHKGSSSLSRRLLKIHIVLFPSLFLSFLNICAKLLQSYLTLCYPMDYSPPGSSVHGDSPGKNTGGLPYPPPRDHPNPGIKPRSPTLQVDSLPSEPPGKPSIKSQNHLLRVEIQS